jgi:hypothetical protein
MATRAIIARQRGDGWEGRYHYSDGYPSGLGPALYDLYHGHFERDLDRLLHVLIDAHPAGWLSIIAADWTRAPGWYPAHPRVGPLRCYCHGDRREPCDLRTSDAPDYEEFLYVLSVASRTMTIFRTGTHVEQLLAIVRLDDPPPDWDRLELAAPGAKAT